MEEGMVDGIEGAHYMVCGEEGEGAEGIDEGPEARSVMGSVVRMEMELIDGPGSCGR